MLSSFKVRVANADQEVTALAINTQTNNRSMRENMGAAGCHYSHAHLNSEAVLGKLKSDFTALLKQGGLA